MKTSDDLVFVLDSNFFFRAFHDTYPPDVFPGFWNVLDNCIIDGRIAILDQVQREIKSPGYLTDLMECHRSRVVSSSTPEVGLRFAELVAWVQASSQFTEVAKNQFRRVADGWIVAYALVADTIIVTHEKYDPNVKKKIPIPNLCEAFGAARMDTVGMLRALGVEFADGVQTTESYRPS